MTKRPGDLAGGNGVHRTTVTRWVREVVGLLAAHAPRLDRALKKITDPVAESYCWTAPWFAPGGAPELRTGRTTPASTNATACS
ncbi:hypothetical protein AADR41_01705 [Streptomyces sp. CLV115]|uniref:hypothetical protein n=1 Tax=Streptomyces sp. CLV115 TaxID=3138502 RepID=UPI00313A9199